MTALFAVFTAHERERCCLNRSRKCRCDRFDFSRKQIFSRRLQFFGPTLEPEKSIKVLLMVDLTIVLFFCKIWKNIFLHFGTNFQRKQKFLRDRKLPVQVIWVKSRWNAYLHFFSVNTPSVLTLQQCWHCNSADTGTVLTLEHGCHCKSTYNNISDRLTVLSAHSPNGAKC